MTGAGPVGKIERVYGEQLGPHVARFKPEDGVPLLLFEQAAGAGE